MRFNDAVKDLSSEHKYIHTYHLSWYLSLEGSACPLPRRREQRPRQRSADRFPLQEASQHRVWAQKAQGTRPEGHRRQVGMPFTGLAAFCPPTQNRFELF